MYIPAAGVPYTLPPLNVFSNDYSQKAARLNAQDRLMQPGCRAVFWQSRPAKPEFPKKRKFIEPIQVSVKRPLYFVFVLWYNSFINLSTVVNWSIPSMSASFAGRARKTYAEK
jgi:uncharacterized protein Usg